MREANDGVTERVCETQDSRQDWLARFGPRERSGSQERAAATETGVACLRGASNHVAYFSSHDRY